MAIPGVGLYGEQMALAEKAYEAALADITRRRNSLLQQLGMRPIMDKNGSIKSLVVDPKNPYGEYQQLRKSEATDLQATENDSLSRGLEADEGLGGQPVSQLRYTQHVGDLNFTRNAMSNLGGLAREQQQALDQKNMTIMQAQEAALQAAMAAGAYGPGPTVPAQTPVSQQSGPVNPAGYPTNAQTAASQQRLASLYGGVRPDDRPGIRGAGAPLPMPWRPPVQADRQRWGMH